MPTTRIKKPSVLPALVLPVAFLFTGVSNLLGTGMVTGVGLLCAAALAGFALAGRRQVPARLAPVLLPASVTSVWFAWTSALSVNPRVSLLGGLGQHNGLTLWLLGLTWVIVGALYSSAPVLRLVMGALSASGAFACLATLFEILTSGLQRQQGFAAGVFDNSSSLGQFLALTVLASTFLVLAEKRVLIRLAAALSAATSLVLMAAVSSRTGLLGVVAGFAVAYAFVRAPALAKRPLRFGFASASLMAAATVAGAAGAVGMLGGATRVLLQRAGTDRGAIWRSATLDVFDAPWFGRGLQQFSAWIQWGLGGGLPTRDPHNVVLALLLGGGIIGAVMAGCTYLLLAASQAQAVRREDLASVLPAAMLSGLAVTSLVSWIDPTAMIAACLVAGIALGGLSSAPILLPRLNLSPAAMRWLIWGAAGIAIAAGVVTLSLLPIEGQLRRTTPTEVLVESYERWPDPAIGYKAMTQLIPSLSSNDAASIELGERLLSLTATDARRWVDLAAGRMLLWRLMHQVDGDMGEFAAMSEAGRDADAHSATWDVLVALEAQARGRDDVGAPYARRALSFELPQDMRAQMEGIIATQRAPMQTGTVQ